MSEAKKKLKIYLSFRTYVAKIINVTPKVYKKDNSIVDQRRRKQN